MSEERRDLSSGQWLRLEQLLALALDLPADRRGEFLDGECADDPALRLQLDSLLAAHEGSGPLDQPLVHVTGSVPSLVGAAPAAGAIVSHYELQERLGSGGMGVVYRARDLRLHRAVALKFLPAAREDAQATRRFLAEARAAAALEHSNVCTVHEIGETEDGQLFIAMAFVDGHSLRQLIERGPLPVAQAVEIARQVAAGLEAAHSHGIVHRDVKPANIMVGTDGVAKLVDFGVAKLAGQTLTGMGGTPGTAAYMSPEQGRGEEVDQRTDVWALGAVLYEMLAGTRPFTGDSPAALLQSINSAQPTSLRKLRPDVPQQLESIVQRALEKDRARRFSSAAALRDALRSLAVDPQLLARPTKVRARVFSPARLAYFTLGLLTLAGIFLVARDYAASSAGRTAAPAGSATQSGAAQRFTIRSLAVLPLANLSSEAEQEYFSDGMTDALIGQLAGIRSLRVISRQSIMRYKNSAIPMPRIARELGVDGVITGTVVKTANRVRISVQLIHAPEDRLLWTDTYERTLGDVLTLQAEIARTVATEVRVGLSTKESARLEQNTTINPQAYDLYLRGRYFWAQRSEEGLRKSIDYFERTLALEPRFAPAYAGLAEAYGPLGYQGFMAPEEATPKMKAAALRALELDPNLVEGLTALAACAAFHEWNWSEGERLFKRAIEVNPNYSTAYGWYGQLLLNRNRPAEALRVRERAYALDPLWVGTASAYAETLAANGRTEEAIALMQRTLELHPNSPLALWYLGGIYGMAGRTSEAIETWAPLGPRGSLGHAYAVTGRRNEALAVLDSLETRARTRFVSPFDFALLYAGLGDVEAALAALERGAASRFPGMSGLLVDRRFAPLANLPRFIAVLKTMGLR